MSNTMVYTKVYRGKEKDSYSKAEVDATIDKLRFVRDCFKAGVNLEVLERQVGLSGGEIQKLERNYREEMERVTGYRKDSLDARNVPDKSIEDKLYANEKLIIRRMLDGEQLRSVCSEIGITVKKRPSGNFVKEMRQKGYFLGKERLHDDITRDIYKGLTVKEILLKYRVFRDEESFYDYFILHQELYGKVDFKLIEREEDVE